MSSGRTLSGTLEQLPPTDRHARIQQRRPLPQLPHPTLLEKQLHPPRARPDPERRELRDRRLQQLARREIADAARVARARHDATGAIVMGRPRLTEESGEA